MIRLHFKQLEKEQRDRIYKASLRVMDEIGIYVEDDPCCAILKKAGARVKAHEVRISPEMVRDVLAMVPKKITFHASNGSELHITGQNKYFGSLLHDPVVADYNEGLRAPRLADIERNAILGDALPHVHFILSLDWHSSDVTTFEVARLRILRSLMINSGKLYWCFPLDVEAFQVWSEMCAICNDGKSLSSYPNVVFAVHIDHSLRFKAKEGELIRAIVEKDIPVNLMAQFFSGSIAPYTLAGTLVMLTACNLFELVLAQSIRPGARCLWGGAGASYNFEKNDASYGGFERFRLIIGLSEMGEYLGLPNSAGAGFTTEVSRYDIQNGIESTLNTAAAVLGPAHMALGMGSLSDGYGMGAEKIVIDHELVAGLMQAREGIDTSDKHLAFDSIKRVGHDESFGFIEDPLTQELMGKGEHYYGTVFDRYAMWSIMNWRTLRTRDDFDWSRLDKKTMYQRAHEKVEDIIASNKSKVPHSRIEALNKYVHDKEVNLNR